MDNILREFLEMQKCRNWPCLALFRSVTFLKFDYIENMFRFVYINHYKYYG
jgi:hypothetical protein